MAGRLNAQPASFGSMRNQIIKRINVMANYMLFDQRSGYTELNRLRSHYLLARRRTYRNAVS